MVDGARLQQEREEKGLERKKEGLEGEGRRPLPDTLLRNHHIRK